MSAYVVNNGTIDDVLGLYYRFGGSDHWTDEEANDLGHRLMAMNLAAVNGRYPNHPQEDAPEGVQYSASPLPGVRDGIVIRDASGNIRQEVFQAIKSTECFLYQCCEGDVPESDLYRDVDKRLGRALRRVVDSMPEYERASWGR